MYENKITEIRNTTTIVEKIYRSPFLNKAKIRSKIYCKKNISDDSLTKFNHLNIFNMDKKSLIKKIHHESRYIKEFVMENINDLEGSYNKLETYPISVVKRATVRNWFNNNGAQYLSLHILPDYKWEKILNSGHFSTAHLICQNDSDNSDNLKVVKLTKGLNNKLISEREIDVLKQISHPYIIKLYTFGTKDDKFWALLEYCNKGSLTEFGLPVEMYLRVKCISHIIQGLDYIHSKNIIHRDIKSDNILVNCDESREAYVFKLGDFNLARELPDYIQKLTVCGTYKYMAPEVLSREKYNMKSDLWGVLCVLIEMILGECNNPICGTTESLIEELTGISNIEIELVKMIHFNDFRLRKDTSEIKDYILSHPVSPLRRTRSGTF